MGELLSIGFAYQLSMVVVTTTILNPHFTPLLGEDLRVELVSFLRWSLPLGLLGLLMTRILLIALVGRGLRWVVSSAAVEGDTTAGGF